MDNIYDYDAIVLGLDINGLGILRSLGSKKLKLLGIYEKDYEIGKFSRYCETIQINSKEYQGDIKLLNLLLNKSRCDKKPVLFATSDFYVSFINTHREILAKRFLFNLPEKEVLDEILNKNGQAFFAKKFGLSIPKAYHPNSLIEGSLAHNESPEFPLIIKPVDNVRNKMPNEYKNVVVGSKEDLEYFYNQHNESREQTIVQEIIKGGENAIRWCTLYIDKNFTPTAIFMARPVRKYKPDFGVTCFSESFYDRKLLAIILKFLKDISYKGLADIEFMYDKDTDQYIFIELNPRTSWVNSQSRGCGVDLSWAQYCDLKNLEYKPNIMCKTGFRWIYFIADFKSFIIRKKKKEIHFIEWVKSILTAKSYAAFDFRDPMPFLYDMFNFLKNTALKICSKKKVRFLKKQWTEKKTIIYT